MEIDKIEQVLKEYEDKEFVVAFNGVKGKLCKKTFVRYGDKGEYLVIYDDESLSKSYFIHENYFRKTGKVDFNVYENVIMIWGVYDSYDGKIPVKLIAFNVIDTNSYIGVKDMILRELEMEEKKKLLVSGLIDNTAERSVRTLLGKYVWEQETGEIDWKKKIDTVAAYIMEDGYDMAEYGVREIIHPDSYSFVKRDGSGCFDIYINNFVGDGRPVTAGYINADGRVCTADTIEEAVKCYSYTLNNLVEEKYMNTTKRSETNEEAGIT